MIGNEREDSAPTGPYAMSQIAKAIFEYWVDYSIIAKKRIDNYRKLLKRADDFAIFPGIELDWEIQL